MSRGETVEYVLNFSEGGFIDNNVGAEQRADEATAWSGDYPIVTMLRVTDGWCISSGNDTGPMTSDDYDRVHSTPKAGLTWLGQLRGTTYIETDGDL